MMLANAVLVIISPRMCCCVKAHSHRMGVVWRRVPPHDTASCNAVWNKKGRILHTIAEVPHSKSSACESTWRYYDGYCWIFFWILPLDIMNEFRTIRLSVIIDRCMKCSAWLYRMRLKNTPYKNLIIFRLI